MPDLIKIVIESRVACLTLHRPHVLNAINDALMDQLVATLLELDQDPTIAVIILTGSSKAFASGIEIPSMVEKDFAQVYEQNLISKNWDTIRKIRKPLIAAVAGSALGGGCELAMMCDMILAAENARFGQPEVKIGTIPGAGGTQRLTRLVGKSKAMLWCLTGQQITAQEAYQSGLVARVFPLEGFVEEIQRLAQEIATQSLPVLMMIKESINQSEEMPLSSGLAFERRMFHATFALNDREEGMRAFVEKRKPNFKHC